MHALKLIADCVLTAFEDIPESSELLAPSSSLRGVVHVARYRLSQAVPKTASNSIRMQKRLLDSGETQPDLLVTNEDEISIEASKLFIQPIDDDSSEPSAKPSDQTEVYSPTKPELLEDIVQLTDLLCDLSPTIECIIAEAATETRNEYPESSSLGALPTVVSTGPRSGFELILAVVPIVISAAEHRKLRNAGRALTSSKVKEQQSYYFCLELHDELSFLENTLGSIVNGLPMPPSPDLSMPPSPDDLAAINAVLGDKESTFHSLLERILQGLDAIVSDKSLSLFKSDISTVSSL